MRHSTFIFNFDILFLEMKTEITVVSPTQREIKIEVPAEALKEAYGKISQKYAKGASVPGFRKGYAPLDVIRMRYKEEIKNEVLQQVVPEKVAEAIQEHKLHPLAEPHLHIDNPEKVKVNGSESVNLHVHVEVMPEIPLPKYEGLEVTRRRRPVEDSELEELITKRLEEQSALIPVEGRKSELGDTVIADLEGTFDDDPNGQPITAENLEVVLGDKVIEKAFTENLIGVAEDEEKDFSVTYADDFTSEVLAGKTVHYKAKVKSVGKMEVPELNDEWANSLDEGYDSLVDLRKKLRADLEIYADADADARVRNIAIAKLIEENSFEVPNTLIENQARNLLNNFAQDLQQRGVDLNKVEPNFVEMAFEQMKTQAERDVRGALLLEKIAEAENVEVSKEEIDAEIGKLAEHYHTTPDEVRESLEKQGGTGSIDNNLRTRKSIEALIAKANIIEGDWVDENAEAVAEFLEKPEKAAKKEPVKKQAKKAAK